MDNLSIIKKGIFTPNIKNLIQLLQKSKNKHNSAHLRLKISKELDLKFLGSGVTASVFELSKNRIVRIEALSESNISKKNKSGFYKWHQFCIDNQNLDIVPKIFSSYIIQNLSKVSFLVTVMEKLTSVYTHAVFSNHETASKKLQAITASKRNLLEPNLKVLSALSIYKKPMFKKSDLIFIRNNFRGINDLHSGNIMVNKSEHRLVITDPIY